MLWYAEIFSDAVFCYLNLLYMIAPTEGKVPIDSDYIWLHMDVETGAQTEDRTSVAHRSLWEHKTLIINVAISRYFT